MKKHLRHWIVALLLIILLSACNKDDSNTETKTTISFTLISSAGTTGGIIRPANTEVKQGSTTSFTVTTDNGFDIDNVTGCNGTLNDNVYTTGTITADCTIIANFKESLITPDLAFVSPKIFRFNWAEVDEATHYRLLENSDGNSGFTQIGSDIPQGTTTIDHVVPLYARVNAQYIIENCNTAGCSTLTSPSVSGSLSSGIGYFKASNTNANDEFSYLSLSNDGNTLAIGAPDEDSKATGIDGDQNDDSITNSGAVYLFTRNGNNWTQQAYIKASNTGAYDDFGTSVDLSDNGNTLAVTAPGEASNATGINGGQTNDSAIFSGAVYLFTRTNSTWNQQAYIKASNTETEDRFGTAMKLSGDGNTLAVGAVGEDSKSTGINGDESNDTETTKLSYGAAYLFTRTDNIWTQQAYIKASNAGAYDEFGSTLTLDQAGDTLAVAATKEDSNATSINGDETIDTESSAGAVYIYSRSNNVWTQEAYVKPDNAETFDKFGDSLSLSNDGNTLAVGAAGEDSNTNTDGTNNAALSSGAVYVFSRSNSSWSQTAYLKASNAEAGDKFGTRHSLSGDGNTLAISATGEDSNAIGINGDENNNSSSNSGAVYLFNRSGNDWTQSAYIKASNTEQSSQYGQSISLNGNGRILAVGAPDENSDAKNIGGNQNDDSMLGAGAVYLY